MRKSRFKKILVPIGVVRAPDQEPGEPLAAPESLRAAEYARDVALEHGASVQLLYVVPKFAMTVAGFEPRPDPANEGRLVYLPSAAGFRRVSPEDVGRERLAQIAERHLGRGVRHQVATRVGKPAEQIIQAAKDEDVDLIVISRHRGEGVLRRFLLGSVAYDVVRGVSCDVLVVGERVRAAHLRAA